MAVWCGVLLGLGIAALHGLSGTLSVLALYAILEVGVSGSLAKVTTVAESWGCVIDPAVLFFVTVIEEAGGGGAQAADPQKRRTNSPAPSGPVCSSCLTSSVPITAISAFPARNAMSALSDTPNPTARGRRVASLQRSR
jgi:hypothetical protein